MSQLGERLADVLDYLADHTPARTVSGRVQAALLSLFLLLVTAVVVWSTGGTHLPFLHLVYIAVILASLTLGMAAGVIAALLGGMLVLGPLMPHQVAGSVSQELPHIILRTFFIVIVAIAAGAFGLSIRRRRDQLEDSDRRLRRLYARNLRLFARLVSERDRETAGHCERVAGNALRIGRAMNLPESKLRNLYWAGMLHDLGKLAVPEAILQKPGPLTEEEFEVVKRHSQVGAEFLTGLARHYEPLAEGVRGHHERWDGTGYPEQLSGTDIPLIARIVAVADVFEAVTSHRPYHAPMEVDEARQLIVDGSGTHFDPEVVAAFMTPEVQDRLTVAGVPEVAYDLLPVAGDV